MRVTIYGLDNDAKEIIDGTITLRNGRLVGDTEKAKIIANEKIEVGLGEDGKDTGGLGEVIDPHKEPERFLRSLCLFYYSAYLTCGKAEELKR